jgi:cytochrome c oxidase cbb3-type subunit II
MQWGSKRTGPDLARIGGKYTDEWQRAHLMDPRSVVPESNMPRYAWLADRPVDVHNLQGTMRVYQQYYGAPYTDEEIENAPNAVKGKSQLDVLIAYLQGLGIDNVIQGAAPEHEAGKL